MYISDNHVCALGYTKDELMHRCVFDLVHPRDQKSVCIQFGVLVASKTKTSVDFRFAHKDGRWIEIRAEGFPVVQNDLIEGYLFVSHTRIAIDAAELRKHSDMQCILDILRRR